LVAASEKGKASEAMHRASEPAILYFGTPVVLISTLNEDGSYNLAPMSSAFWLGWRCMLGLDASSKTPENMLRTGECVLNLPSDDLVASVNCLARKTGTNPVPKGKQFKGYEFEPNKFWVSGLSPQPSETVLPPRVLECPVQMEAKVEGTHPLAEDEPGFRGKVLVFEVRVQRVHLEDSILVEGEQDRIDPDRWHPLIMSFQHFYKILPRKLYDSELAGIPESMYRSPDIDRARQEATVSSSKNP
jgi:flavin reductase (DIM6/NTAB) family NADH-FMN oxidoreductase RutF